MDHIHRMMKIYRNNRIRILEELEHGPLGRRFRARVTRGTAKGYEKGSTFAAYACQLWDATQRVRGSLRIAWSGRKWLDTYTSN